MAINTGHTRRQPDGFWTYQNPALASEAAARNKYRLGNILKTHLGREVSYSELRDLRM